MNASTQHPTSNPKTKLLIFAVALGVIVGQVLTFLGGLANKTGWDVLQLPCECAWTVLAFPLGWLGLFAPAFDATRSMLPYRYLFLWTGVTLNGLLWAWIVYRIVRSLQFSGTHPPFDATALSRGVTELRQSHVAAAHARSHPPYARKGLLAIATRAVRHCAYFLNRKPPGPEPQLHHHEP